MMRTRLALEMRLPATVVSTLGERVDTSSDVWRVKVRRVGNQHVTLNFRKLDHPLATERRAGGKRPLRAPIRASVLDASFRHLARCYLADCITRVNPTHARGLLGAFRAFERFLHSAPASYPSPFTVGDIDLPCFEAFRRECIRRSDNGRYATHLRAFYKWGCQRLPSTYSSEILRALKKVKCPSSAFGHLVRMEDPRYGALSWEERVEVESALSRGITVRDLRVPIPDSTRERLQDHALVWLLYRLGVRSCVLPLFCCKHLRPLSAGANKQNQPDMDGIDVPRVKRQGGSSPEDTVYRTIPWGLSRLLHSLRASTTDPEAPLLPWLLIGDANSHIRKALARFAAFHNLRTTRLPVEDASDTDFTLCPAAPVLLPLTPHRLRRNFATVLAEQGASEEEVAAALDDTTLAMAAVYVQQTKAFFGVLRDTLDRYPEWIRILALFKGDIGATPSRDDLVVLGGAPFLADYEAYADIGPIAHCTARSCNKHPPVSCYLCEYAKPVEDPRPHERQLQQILRDADFPSRVASERSRVILRRHAAAIFQLIGLLDTRPASLRGVLARIRATATSSSEVTLERSTREDGASHR